MTGVNFCEGIECEYDLRVENSWKRFSITLDHTISLSNAAKITVADLQGFGNLTDLKPSSEVKAYCEKMLSEYSLGYKDWFYECKDFWLKEQFKTMHRDEIDQVLSMVSKTRKRELEALLKQAEEMKTAGVNK